MGRSVSLAIVISLSMLGCDDTGHDSSSSPTWTPAPMATVGVRYDQQLHDELMAMFRHDQAGRTGGIDNEGDDARTQRLKEIIAEHGWPTIDLVGKDGANAAWAIVQDSDLDPDFHTVVLELLTAAAKADQASWGNVAYLDDRIAVAKGAKQTYGSQITCTESGASVTTPLAKPDRIEQLRAKAGMEPMHVYLNEMERFCALQPAGG